MTYRPIDVVDTLLSSEKKTRYVIFLVGGDDWAEICVSSSLNRYEFDKDKLNELGQKFFGYRGVPSSAISLQVFGSSCVQASCKSVSVQNIDMKFCASFRARISPRVIVRFGRKVERQK